MLTFQNSGEIARNQSQQIQNYYPALSTASEFDVMLFHVCWAATIYSWSDALLNILVTLIVLTSASYRVRCTVVMLR